MAIKRPSMVIQRRKTLMKRMVATKRTRITKDSSTDCPQQLHECLMDPISETHRLTKEQTIINRRYQVHQATPPPCKEVKLAIALPMR